VADVLGHPREGPRRLLNYYTADGLEYGLERYRVLPLIRRLGFGGLRVSVDQVGACDRARVLGKDLRTGREHTLIEMELERRRLGDGMFLFVNWLSLRNPRASFSGRRPQLPGQEVPGLGLAREMTQILGLIAQRLRLEGVAFRPSWYHMAFAARQEARFVDAGRQGRFEALCRDVKYLPLREATHAVADGRVLLEGVPYEWEADEMVSYRPEHRPQDAEAVAAARDRAHFTVVPGPALAANG
jgi:hypothetical protein